MSLSIGIVGLPNVGKSTLFNALTKKRADASNYPFCTIDPNVGIVKVPDPRLDKIAEISKPKKVTPTVIEFTDIAGLVKGAHKGEGLGNQFLHHIRQCDAVCEVLRGFEDDNIIHVEGSVNPERDRETISLELIYADLQTVEKRLEKLSKESKSGDKELVWRKNLLEKIQTQLNAGRRARDMELNNDELKIVKSLGLLTLKPILYIMNVNGNTGPNHSLSSNTKNGIQGETIRLNVKLEEEIAGLGEDEQKEYIEELGLEESGLDLLIGASYRLLDLLTFFTTGLDETRAWTVKQGTKAPEAAGKIHTDFEKGFIRVEVIKWDKFVELGGEAKAKEKGLVRTEGKEYIVQDGDICHFLFSK